MATPKDLEEAKGKRKSENGEGSEEYEGKRVKVKKNRS